MTEQADQDLFAQMGPLERMLAIMIAIENAVKTLKTTEMTNKEYYEFMKQLDPTGVVIGKKKDAETMALPEHPGISLLAELFLQPAPQGLPEGIVFGFMGQVLQAERIGLYIIHFLSGPLCKVEFPEMVVFRQPCIQHHGFRGTPVHARVAAFRVAGGPPGSLMVH